MDNHWQIEEYKQLRHEIALRIQILHGMIALASILLCGVIITAFWSSLSALHLLLLPLVFAGLTFNYQANQMTMEAVARYIQARYNEHLHWDDVYAKEKVPNRLTSFLKITPLLLPLLTPLFVFAYFPNLTPSLTALAWTDIFIFILVVYNFRYKL